MGFLHRLFFVMQRKDHWNFSNAGECWNYLRGRSFVIQIPDDGQETDLATLQRNVAAHPADDRARRKLGAALLTVGSLDAAYTEFQEVVRLQSNSQNTEEASRRLADRAFTRYLAATTLEQMGRDAEAREQWQACAEDWRSAIPDEKHLAEITYYTEAMDKLRLNSTV